MRMLATSNKYIELHPTERWFFDTPQQMPSAQHSDYGLIGGIETGQSLHLELYAEHAR